MPTNPTDKCFTLTVPSTAYVEYNVQLPNGCSHVTVKQRAGETAIIFNVKHRDGADGSEAYETIAAGGVWTKGDIVASGRNQRYFKQGDTIGFFARNSGSGDAILEIVEHEV